MEQQAGHATTSVIDDTTTSSALDEEKAASEVESSAASSNVDQVKTTSELSSTPTDSKPSESLVDTTELPESDCSVAAATENDTKPNESSTETNATQPTDNSCYRYEGDVCVYTDEASGIEYIYCTDGQCWKPRDGHVDVASDTSSSELKSCFYIGENYCYRNDKGALYRLVTETNTWELWAENGDNAETPAIISSSSCAVTSGGEDKNYFKDASGTWCYRSGAECFRWQGPAGWAPVTKRGQSAGKRRRRPNRGSSDESEHDTDEEEEEEKKEEEQPLQKKRVHTECADGEELESQPEEASMDDPGSRSFATHVNDDGVTIYTDPADGTKYEWDPVKSAWFPQVDEEFLALHSLNYGFDADGRPVEAPPILQSLAPPPELAPPIIPELAPPADLAPPTVSGPANKARQMKAKKQPEWFEMDETKNTKVYVTGLDETTTEGEFVELMSKCGLVMKDTATGKWKVKLYEDDYGIRKGDALCTYIKVESVDLAKRILDGSQFKNRTISVQPARFSMRGQFDPKLKPKKRQLKRKDRERLQKKQERLFAWQPDRVRGERERHERVMVLTNSFDPREFDQRPQLMLEYRQDVNEECAKYGTVKKVVIHDRHPEGVVEVVFSEAAEADACIAVMNGRWFAGRQITAATWDGKTKYRVEETEEERKKRLENWDKFVAGDVHTEENTDNKS